nr:hypothetical protein [Aquisalinus luteolus]
MKFPTFRRNRRSTPDTKRRFLDTGSGRGGGDRSTDIEGDDDMAEGFHVPYGKLSAKTLKMHYAISSLMEELEAVDWYAQRADDCDDAELREILLHNMREEVEHAMMTLEWLRRNDETFAKEMKDYLFTEGNILEQEHEVMGRNGD